MSRSLYGIIFLATLLGGLVHAASLPERNLTDFQYTGKRHSPEKVEQVLEMIQPLLPEAVQKAESLLEMVLDSERLDLTMADLPTGKRGLTRKMGVAGIDHPVLLVYIEPVLRGDFHDSEALLLTLTHEMIHVLVRQNIDHHDYKRLPEWFQEGIPHFLLGQTLDKMIVKVAIKYDNPYAVLGGFEGGHFALPEVTGGFFFAELEAQVGRQGMLEFINAVLATVSVEQGLEAVGILDAEMSDEERKSSLDVLWSGSRQRAHEAMESYTGAVAGPFFECMDLYNKGSRDKGISAIHCFEELISAHPGSYAADVSLYWLAKCHFRRRELEPALKWMEAFADCRLNYGLLDNSLYFRIRLYKDLGLQRKLEEACRQYLELFPDGADLAKVRKISNS